MTTKRVSDILEHDRVQLVDVVPLSTPYKINIEVTNLCNLRCEFCPTSKRELTASVRPHGIMSYGLYKKIVNDLRDFPNKIKLVELYMDGEPLVNRYLPEMARYLVDAQVAERVQLRTNGTLLTDNIIERLSRAGFDRIIFSIVAPNAEGYKKHAGLDIDYPALLDNIGKLFRVRGNTKMHVQMIALPDCKPQDITAFENDFMDKCDSMSIEKLYGWSAGDYSLGTSHPPAVRPIACPFPLYQLTINWNGTVRTCCADWSWQTIIGDASTLPVRQVWEGERLRDFQIMHLEGRRADNPACATCDKINVALDKIDTDRLTILGKL